MSETAHRTPAIAKRLAIVTAVVCVLIFAPSIMPAGFAIYLLDTPGRGALHVITVWGSIAILLLMPVISLLGSIVPWRCYKRGNNRLAIIWCLCTLALIPFWVMLAYIFYST